MASSSSSSVAPFNYDVFLSFRGEDTRNNFMSHLRAALQRASIKAYKDDEDLKRGDEISPALREAIETSRLYVIIFSENYASSSWCLEELSHILECQKNYNRSVLPVFYGVDPSDVRHQRGSFAINEERFGTDKHINKFRKWRNALKAAANQAGWDSKVIRPESCLVENIVKDIISKINQTPSSNNFQGLVGITKRAAKIESLLNIGSSAEIQKVGIWGVGGIGKTTLARVVFDRLSDKFESSCFLENIRGKWGKGQKDDLKTELFSKLLKEKNPNMGTLSLGSTYDKDRLRRRKVLIVFDDVDDLEPLRFLSENYSWFGPGSKIIITTRDMQVLRKQVDEIYQVERLDNEEALRLFHSNAYKKAAPREDLLHLSKRVINHCEGIPLALEVLGSFFCGKKEENWTDELEKLKECPHQKIQSILRISFDGLDRKQKCIFQDIACFFKGACRDFVERILDACGLYAKSGIDDLIDKSLVTIKDDSKLWMHDLVQEMGWEIEQSIKELPRRSRLWNPEDVECVLKTDIGTATIEGLFLDMSSFSEAYFNPAAFRNMYNLRLLKIFHSNKLKKCEVRTPSVDDRDLQSLPDALRYLHWEKYPWKSFPSSFRPRHLVELDLPHSEVHKLWEGKVDLKSLKKIDLGYSKNLLELPDLSEALKLEHVYLECCTSLQEVPSYFQHLNNLITLFLNGCSSMRVFPKLPWSIVCLVLSGTAIEEVPSSIEHLSHLEILILNDCKKLLSLPDISKSMMKNIKALSLEGTKFASQQLSLWINNLATPSQLAPYWETNVFMLDRRNLSDGPREFLFNRFLLSSGRENCREARLNLGLIDSKILHPFRTKLLFGADIGAFCPGRENPKWFLHQASFQISRWRNILNVGVDLPPNPFNHNFCGFVVFAIAVTNPYLDYFCYQELQLLCKPNFIMHDGRRLSWDSDWLTSQEAITKVEFEFLLCGDFRHVHNFGHDLTIECTGICLLYEEDVKNLGLPDNQQDSDLEYELDEEDWETSEESKSIAKIWRAPAKLVNVRRRRVRGYRVKLNRTRRLQRMLTRRTNFNWATSASSW